MLSHVCVCIYTLCKVHVLLGFWMDGDGSIHSRRCALFWFARLVTSLSAAKWGISYVVKRITSGTITSANEKALCHYVFRVIISRSVLHLSRSPPLMIYEESTYLPVMFFFHQMIARSECDEVSVVGRCGNGDRPGATDVCVAQLIRKSLQLVSRESVIVPENVIMRWPRRTLL